MEKQTFELQLCAHCESALIQFCPVCTPIVTAPSSGKLGELSRYVDVKVTEGRVREIVAESMAFNREQIREIVKEIAEEKQSQLKETIDGQSEAEKLTEQRTEQKKE